MCFKGDVNVVFGLNGELIFLFLFEELCMIMYGVLLWVWLVIVVVGLIFNFIFLILIFVGVILS